MRRPPAAPAAPAAKIQPFTVIGFYEASGETFAYLVRAAGPHEAIAIACGGDYIDMGAGASGIAILGAIAGDVTGKFTRACEDSGNMAYACDVMEGQA